MTHCRWVNDREIGRYHVPGCWGAAASGPECCICPDEETDLAQKVAELEQRIEKLEARGQ